MKKLLTAVSVSIILNSTAFALPDNHSTNGQQPEHQTQYHYLDPDSEKLLPTYLRLFRDYDKRNFAITRSVRILLKHYPQHVEAILLSAFHQQPERYRQIISAAINAEPALTQDVIGVAMNIGISDTAEIVKTAILAEPSYADDIVQVASHMQPQEVEHIVRVAIDAEPDLADEIVRSAADSQPNKISEIFLSALKAIPATANYIAESVSSLWQEDDSELGALETIPLNNPTQTAAIKQREQARLREILVGAINAGIPQSELSNIAYAVGISETELEAMYASADD